MCVTYPGSAFVGVESFTDFLFFSHNFASRYTRKPMKGSKDSDDNLDSKKKLKPKNGSLSWRPGPGKLSPKHENMPQLLRYPQKNPNIKQKIF